LNCGKLKELLSFLKRNKLEIVWTCVVRGWANNLAIDSLLDDMCTPAGGTSNSKELPVRPSFVREALKDVRFFLAATIAYGGSRFVVADFK